MDYKSIVIHIFDLDIKYNFPACRHTLCLQALHFDFDSLLRNEGRVVWLLWGKGLFWGSNFFSLFLFLLWKLKVRK